jgi:hypothetical protein
MFKTGIYIFAFLAFSFFLISEYNKNKLKISHTELSVLKKEFGSITIQTDKDLFIIQNKVINSIINQKTEINNLDIIKTIEVGKGLCYERSFILQKILVYNNIKVRPVYLFFNCNKPQTYFYDFIKKSICSHNIFEFYWNNNWYIMRTNSMMKNFETINFYLQNSTVVPSHTRYIRYLNNRNGKFIYPSIFPDVYF